MRPTTRPLALAAVTALALLLALAVIWSVTREGPGATSGAGPEGGRGAGAGSGPSPLTPEEAARAWVLPFPTGAEGWEEAAETVAIDMRGLVLGRPITGAYQEARAEAARRDLALHPPSPERLRRLLLSPSSSDRVLALTALSARGEATDDLVRIALRSAKPWDEDLLRFLLADLAAALPPEQAARHEDELLGAFGREPNPLILAVALPALERLEPGRLRDLVEAQLAVASPEMIPVLAGIARDRLPPEALRSVGISVFEGGAAPAGAAAP